MKVLNQTTITNHARNAVRFCIVVFWLIVIGVALTAVSNVGNAHAIGWPTYLFYAIAATVTTYVGVFASKNLWSLK